MAPQPKFFTSLLLLLLAGIPVLAGPYYVRKNGDDAADGRTPATAFATVLRAAQALNHQDWIVIGPGTYKTTVFIADRWSDMHPVGIQGDENGTLTNDPAGPIIIEPQNSTEPAITFSRCRNIEISGLTLRGPGQGIKLEGCNGVLVQRMTFNGLSGAPALLKS